MCICMQPTYIVPLQMNFEELTLRRAGTVRSFRTKQATTRWCILVLYEQRMEQQRSHSPKNEAHYFDSNPTDVQPCIQKLWLISSVSVPRAFLKPEPTILVLEVKTKLKRSSIGLFFSKKNHNTHLVLSGPINHQYNTDLSKKLIRIDLIRKLSLHNNIMISNN